MNKSPPKTVDPPVERRLSDPPGVCFVLSAGRTGTVFLTHLLAKNFPQAYVVHEPFPARFELILGNLRNDTGFGEGLLRRLLQAARSRRLSCLREGRSYIELNPMLCPLCDLLPQLTQSFSIVHMVREPLSWATSIASFRASKPFRSLIRFVPFAKPYPHPRPEGWPSLNELERALWRWRFCNERIRSLRPHSRHYTVLRYEDIFSEDPERRSRSLGQLLIHLPVGFDGSLPNADFAARANPKPVTSHAFSISEARVKAICGDLMSCFGYAE